LASSKYSYPKLVWYYSKILSSYFYVKCEGKFYMRIVKSDAVLL